MSQSPMDRREAVRVVSSLLGGIALVGGESLWRRPLRAMPAPGEAAGAFAPNEVALLDEAAETILPETSTPGAKAARCGAFIALMVTDTYEPRDQRIFRRGLLELESAARAATGGGFLQATPAQRLSLLDRFDREAKAFMEDRPSDEPAHWFRMLKQLTLVGYFTSEIGMTQHLRYLETPGRFDPCVPYNPGDRDWARHA